MMSRLYQLETGNRKPLPYLNLHYKHLYDIILLTFIKCPEVYMQGIASSSLVGYITEHAAVLKTVGIFFPFLLAAILKSAQGSSTVAITTTAGILAPLMAPLGLATVPLSALTVMAIGAGAMTVSHANDSYFWVVTTFGGLKAEDGYKTQTLMTLVIGIASIIGIFIISLFL